MLAKFEDGQQRPDLASLSKARFFADFDQIADSNDREMASAFIHFGINSNCIENKGLAFFD